MAKLLVKNWRDFQHYKDRAPSWIKLHRSLLDNYEFQRLPLASRALAPMIWLLASESEDGSVDYDLEKLSFRLHQSKKEIEDGIKPLISAGFLELEQDASNPLADAEQPASLEKRREEKRESRATTFPEGYQPNQSHKNLALELGIDLRQEFPIFREHHKSNGSTFKSWDAALSKWIHNAKKFAKQQTIRIPLETGVSRKNPAEEMRRQLEAD